MPKKESKFQKEVMNDIQKRIPGSMVFKVESYKQGFPDLMVIHKDKWAALEVKKSRKAHHQPNQDYYVDKLNNMSFSRFIFPENKEEVLNDLERSFATKG